MTMPRCEQCTPAEPDGTFCAVCGSFLGWEQTEDPLPPTRPAPPSTAAARQPRPDGQETAAAHPTPPTTDLTGDRAETTGPTPDQAAPTTARPGDVVATPEPATAVPSWAEITASEATGAVEAVQPARPQTRRPVVRQRPPAAEQVLGELVCPVCATSNPRDRRFCRRCGTPLDAASTAPATRVSWWRRCWRVLRRAARWLVRRRSGVWGLLHRLAAVLLAAALLAGLGYGAVRLGSRASDAVRDRIATPQPVSPVSVGASSQARNHPAELVADGLSNSYWAPDRDGDGRGEYVELTFAAPFRLLDLIIHTGVSAQQDVFLRQARPAELELTVWTSRPEPERTALRLADRAGPQTFRHVAADVVRIRLTVLDSYGSAPGRRTAIGEVEVFRRP